MSRLGVDNKDRPVGTFGLAACLLCQVITKGCDGEIPPTSRPERLLRRGPVNKDGGFGCRRGLRDWACDDAAGGLAGRCRRQARAFERHEDSLEVRDLTQLGWAGRNHRAEGVVAGSGRQFSRLF